MHQPCRNPFHNVFITVPHCLQLSELPTAQMYAKLHAKQQQQQPGSRAHVVKQQPGSHTGEPEPADGPAITDGDDDTGC